MAHIDYDLWLLMYRALSTFKISATNIDIVASVAVNACIDFRFGHALNFNKSKDCCGNAAVGKKQNIIKRAREREKDGRTKKEKK